MNDRYLLDPTLLPSGFKYPASFVAFANNEERVKLEPWWLLSIRKESTLFWLHTLRAQYPERSLIPFAKMEDSDDLACFDGLDTNGDPKVFYVHAYTTPGWEHRGEAGGFDQWLSDAIEQARRHAEEQD
jgi:hypothetical protein